MRKYSSYSLLQKSFDQQMLEVYIRNLIVKEIK
jgi:hypothetical protein